MNLGAGIKGGVYVEVDACKRHLVLCGFAQKLMSDHELLCRKGYFCAKPFK